MRELLHFVPRPRKLPRDGRDGCALGKLEEIGGPRSFRFEQFPPGGFEIGLGLRVGYRLVGISEDGLGAFNAALCLSMRMTDASFFPSGFAATAHDGPRSWTRANRGW